MTVKRAPTFAGALRTALLSSRRSRMAVVTHGVRSRSGTRMHSCTKGAARVLHSSETALRAR
eukprot:2194040-Prymnesium_polylepis.1